MGFFDKLFGKKKPQPSRPTPQPAPREAPKCQMCGKDACYRVQMSPKGDLDGKIVCKECSVPGMIAGPI